MTLMEIVWLVVLGAGLVALLITLRAKRETGSPVAAAVLLAMFGSFTAAQLGQEGVIEFYVNHTQNLAGLQVWWDLIMATLIALFVIAPRARAQGMNVTAWGLLVGTTASIGLLAMCARLFWLERQAAARTA